MTTKMTELRAVNRMLLGIKRLPLETLDTVGTNVEASLALDILYTVTQELLSSGLSYNTKIKTLSPDTNAHIHPPARTLALQASPNPNLEPKDYLVFDGKLYDAEEDTNEFASSIELSIVYDVDFDDLPFVIQAVVLHESRKAFTLEIKGKAVTPAMVATMDRDIGKARGVLMGWDSRQNKVSLIGSNTGLMFQSRNTPRR